MNIGLDLGGHTIGAALVKGSSIISMKETSTPETRRPDDVLKKLLDLIGDLSKGRSIDSIGIGVPGLVKNGGNTVDNLTNFPGWRDYPLSEAIEQRTGIATKIDNDANCAALGELTLKDKKNCNFLLLTLGTGIGGAIVTDGILLRGHNGYAGEFGQNLCQEKGRFVPLESIFGADAFDRRCREYDLKSTAHLWSLRDTPPHMTYWDKAIYALSASIASYVHIMDPERIIFSGGLSKLPNLIDKLYSITEKLLKNRSQVPIFERSQLEEKGPLIGASLL